MNAEKRLVELETFLELVIDQANDLKRQCAKAKLMFRTATDTDNNLKARQRRQTKSALLKAKARIVIKKHFA